MAIIPVHQQITQKVMLEEGFSAKSVDLAKEANAAVDLKQGNQAAETNLHAMRGFVNGLMQTEQEARDAVSILLATAKTDILDMITGKDKDYRKAAMRLGEALHTVQDGAVHHFEPWPYSGIGSAVLHDPIYMAKHVYRDMGYNRFLMLGSSSLPAGGYQLTGEVGLATSYSSLGWFPSEIGLRADYASDDGRSGRMSGMLTISWGPRPAHNASPSSRVSQQPSLGITPPLVVTTPDYSVELDSAKPEEIQAAEDNSRGFVQSVKKAAGPAWDPFVKA